jgi:hypothetical protein
MIQGSYQGFKDREKAEADRQMAIEREEWQDALMLQGARQDEAIAQWEALQGRTASEIEASGLATTVLPSDTSPRFNERIAEGDTVGVDTAGRSLRDFIGPLRPTDRGIRQMPPSVGMPTGPPLEYHMEIPSGVVDREGKTGPTQKRFIQSFEKDADRIHGERQEERDHEARLLAEQRKIERASEASDVAFRILQEKNRAAEAAAAAQFRIASLAAQQSPSEASLKSLEGSAIKTVEAWFKGNALNPERPSTFDLDGLKNDLRRARFSESRIEGVIEKAKYNVIQELSDLGIAAWTAENTDAESAIPGMPAPVPDESVRADIWRRMSELVDPPDISPGIVPGPTPVPNVREIVEEVARPDGWGSLSVEDQLAEFEAPAPEGYGLSRKESVALFSEVNKAVTSIRKTVEYQRPRRMTRAESVSARPQPEPGEGYRSLRLRRQQAQTLGDLAAMAPVDEQNAKILSDAVDRYFSTLNP